MSNIQSTSNSRASAPPSRPSTPVQPRSVLARPSQEPVATLHSRISSHYFPPGGKPSSNQDGKEENPDEDYAVVTSNINDRAQVDRRPKHIDTKDTLELKYAGPHATAVCVTTQPVRGRKGKGSTPKGELDMTFRYAGSVDTNGSGLGVAALPWDVSAAADFSSAAALFSECKVIKARCQLESQLLATGTNVRGHVGVDYALTNSAPASESAVLQLERLKMHCAAKTVPTVITAKAGTLGWAATASPIPGPYAGLYGQFSVAAVGTATSGYVNYLVTVVVRFRGRK